MFYFVSSKENVYANGVTVSHCRRVDTEKSEEREQLYKKKKKNAAPAISFAQHVVNCGAKNTFFSLD